MGIAGLMQTIEPVAEKKVLSAYRFTSLHEGPFVTGCG
jgi:hypothetical protein